MQSNFPTAVALVLKSEGGFVDNPSDPGGATNMGITAQMLAAWRGIKSVPVSAIKALTAAEATAIYRSRYWNAVHGDALPKGLDYAVFDYAVNSGVSTAVKALQRTLGVADDGSIGPVTLAAAAKAPAHTIIALCDQRLGMLERLTSWPTFGAGWANRIRDVRGEALQQAGD